jgi:Chitin synthase export chaperone
MMYVVLGILQEFRPLGESFLTIGFNELPMRLSIAYYIGAALLFVFSQLAYFLLSKVICKGTGAKVDGSFLATFLEASRFVPFHTLLLFNVITLALQTASIGVLFTAWISITEGALRGPFLSASRNLPYTSFTDSWDNDYYPT